MPETPIKPGDVVRDQFRMIFRVHSISADGLRAQLVNPNGLYRVGPIESLTPADDPFPPPERLFHAVPGLEVNLPPPTDIGQHLFVTFTEAAQGDNTVRLIAGSLDGVLKWFVR